MLKNGVWRFESDNFDRFSLATIDSSKNRTCEYSQYPVSTRPAPAKEYSAVLTAYRE